MAEDGEAGVVKGMVVKGMTLKTLLLIPLTIIPLTLDSSGLIGRWRARFLPPLLPRPRLPAVWWNIY